MFIGVISTGPLLKTCPKYYLIKEIPCPQRPLIVHNTYTHMHITCTERLPCHHVQLIFLDSLCSQTVFDSVLTSCASHSVTEIMHALYQGYTNNEHEKSLPLSISCCITASFSFKTTVYYELQERFGDHLTSSYFAAIFF